MSGIHAIVKGLTALGDILKHPLLLFMRLFWGIAFFYAGWGKLQNIDSVINFFTSVDIPFPNILAYLVALFETLGGVLLVFGLGSRIIAIPLIAIMTVAYAKAHYAVVENFMQNPQGFVQETPFLYLLTALLVLCFGPGAFSLDAIIKHFKLERR
ncbi:MAG: DoxX family protein [Waddliaceae bacterium]